MKKNRTVSTFLKCFQNLEKIRSYENPSFKKILHFQKNQNFENIQIWKKSKLWKNSKLWTFYTFLKGFQITKLWNFWKRSQIFEKVSKVYFIFCDNFSTFLEPPRIYFTQNFKRMFYTENTHVKQNFQN